MPRNVRGLRAYLLCVLTASVSCLRPDCASSDAFCRPEAWLTYLLVPLSLALDPNLLPITPFQPTNGRVQSFQKISSLAGGFTGSLDDGDRFGASTAAPGDFDGDGIQDVAVGSYFDDDGGLNRGAVYILFLNADGTVKGRQKISNTAGNFTAPLPDNGLFGGSVTFLNDMDGDGVAEVAVGAPEDNDGGAARGAVYILFLNANGTVKSYQKISDTQSNFLGTLQDFDRFGSALASPGDLDGDGVPDIVTSVPFDDDGGSARGALQVLFLNANGSVKAEQKISDLAGNFTGTLLDNNQFGTAVAAPGDIDGDGVMDLISGAFQDADGGTGRGAVWVLFMNANGTVKSQQKISSLAGNFTGVLDNGTRFGIEVAGNGDLDGDGVPDIVVGADGDDDGGTFRGATWTLFLNSNGTVKSYQKISSTIGGFAGPLVDGDQFGKSAAVLRDFNGDFVPDLVVGADLDADGGPGRGAIWILFLEAAL